MATDSCLLHHSPYLIAANKKSRSELWDLKPVWLYLNLCQVDQCQRKNYQGRGKKAIPFWVEICPNASCSPS